MCVWGSAPETISVVASGTGLTYQWYKIDSSAGTGWELSNGSSTYFRCHQ